MAHRRHTEPRYEPGHSERHRRAVERGDDPRHTPWPAHLRTDDDDARRADPTAPNPASQHDPYPRSEA